MIYAKMKKLKKTLGIFILLITTSGIFAASQVPDLCVFKKDSIQDTLSVFIFPLEDFFDIIGDKDLKGFKYCESPSCVRGYQAIWEIQNDSLFLISIQGCNEQMSWCDESAMPDLKLMFGSECENNKVFAYWVNSNYRFFEGKEVPLIDKQIYKADRIVKVRKGIITKNKRKLNIKPKKKANEINLSTPEFILYTIHNNFNWRDLPKIKKDKWYAELEITVKKNRKTSIKIITDTPENFRIAAEKEYNKSLKKVRWYKYKQLGKKVELKFTVRAYFERNDQKITIVK